MASMPDALREPLRQWLKYESTYAEGEGPVDVGDICSWCCGVPCVCSLTRSSDTTDTIEAWTNDTDDVIDAEKQSH